MRYANVWAVDREYGGPEEGGWWYNVGECIRSIAIDDDVDEETALEWIRAEYPETGKRYSVLSGEDYEVSVDNKPLKGETFPNERPYYE